MSERVTRRTFLGTSSKAAAGVAAGMSLAGCAATGGKTATAAVTAPRKKFGANEKFTIALIGCGGMGRFKLGNFMDSKQCDVAMVCDVHDTNANGAAKGVKDKLGQTVKTTRYYDEVLDNKDIDFVIIGTPDHWHAAPMMAACAAGKDVYCEKPCSHNILEAKAMIDAAQKYNRIVQVGTHQRSIIHLGEAREWIRNGGLGTISQTNTFTYGNDTPNGLGNEPDEPAPADCDYDRWLGAAPVRPYNRRRFHSSWRWYFDYASGMVGDWNVHLQDIVMWTMGVPAPKAVSCSGGKLVLTDDRTTPDTMQAVYEFGPSEMAPKGWTHTYTMRKASGRPWSAGGYGMVFHGTNGKAQMDRSYFKVEGDAKNWQSDHSKRVEDFENRNGNDLQGHASHVANFLDCLRTNNKPIATIESHYNTVVACHLANVSLRVGRKIFWDACKLECFKDADLRTPDREANKLLTREYRKGYELPNVL